MKERYWLYCVAQFFASNCPRSLAYTIASLLSILRYCFAKVDREIVRYNLLPIVKDERKVKVYTKEIIRNFSYYLVDFFRLQRIDGHFVKKFIKIEGLDYLNEVVFAKKGAIILTAHLGNYELGGALIAYLGYDLGFDIYGVALPHKDKRIDEFFNRKRLLYNLKVIPTGVVVKKCIQILKEGHMVAFLGDRDFTSAKGERVHICGKEAMLPKGPAYFSTKTGAPILPAFFVREKKYFYRLIIEPTIYPNLPDREKTMEEVIVEYSKVLEKYIKLYPDQWYMFAKYWL
ncbi:MAG: lysophospholipid acyltransferase family protein [Candidatus Omnitrophica bacterium]|nr:lysophospholipid acyltransferase family protein [Candidatus Omnitrophota bacterium]